MNYLEIITEIIEGVNYKLESNIRWLEGEGCWVRADIKQKQLNLNMEVLDWISKQRSKTATVTEKYSGDGWLEDIMTYGDTNAIPQQLTQSLLGKSILVQAYISDEGEFLQKLDISPSSFKVTRISEVTNYAELKDKHGKTTWVDAKKLDIVDFIKE